MQSQFAHCACCATAEGIFTQVRGGSADAGVYYVHLNLHLRLHLKSTFSPFQTSWVAAARRQVHPAKASSVKYYGSVASEHLAVQ